MHIAPRRDSSAAPAPPAPSGAEAPGSHARRRATTWLALGGLCTLLVAPTVAQAACEVGWLAGDPIGPDATLTSNTGGFTAVQAPTVNLGQPAVLALIEGNQQLSELRAVVFGVPTAAGALRFDQFDYRLEVWSAADYFAGLEPTLLWDLGDPTNATLVEQPDGSVTPDEPFGTAGVGGGDAPTYDLRFDLSGWGPDAALPQPLEPGYWVFGFQSWHDPFAYGSLRVAGSSATQAPLPLFSREGFERGVLGGQDPDNLVLTWGLALEAESILGGAPIDDGEIAPLTAVEWWQRDFGAACAVEPLEGDLNRDASVDGFDLLLWQRIVDPELDAGSATAAPEPPALVLAALALVGLRGVRLRSTRTA